jgi:hypothetical protein
MKENLVSVETLTDLNLDLMVVKARGVKDAFIADGFVTHLNDCGKRRDIIVDWNYIGDLFRKVKIKLEFVDNLCQVTICDKEGKLYVSQDYNPLVAIKRCIVLRIYGWKINARLLERVEKESERKDILQ